MNRLVLTAILVFCTIISINAQPAWQWVRSITGSGTTVIGTIYTTPDNKILAGGYFDGTLDIGENGITSEGGYDALLLSLDTNGNLLWVTSFGGTGMDYILYITTDSDNNIWVAGAFSQTMSLGNIQLTSNGERDIFVAKYNPANGWQNAVSVGSIYDDTAGGLAVASDGSVYLAGAYRQAITIGTTVLTHNYYCSFISRWDANLNNLWAIQPNDYGEGFSFRNVGVDLLDNVYLMGDFNYHCSFNTTNPIHLYSQHTDAFAAKFNPSGSCLWAIKIGMGSNVLNDAYTLPSGEFYLSSELVAFPVESKVYHRPNIIPLIAKFNANGALQWYDDDNELTYCLSTKMAAHTNGNVFLTGFLLGVQVFGEYTLTGSLMNWEIFVAKANSEGVWQWGLQTTGSVFPNEARPVDITYIDNDNFILAGRYRSNGVSFGNISIPPTNQTSAFIVKGGAETVSNNDLTEAQSDTRISVYPNPFSDKLKIDFTLDKAQSVSGGIYNIKGQLVKSFPSVQHSKGKHSLTWDGLTSQGTTTACGLYLVKLQAGNKTSSKIIVRK